MRWLLTAALMLSAIPSFAQGPGMAEPSSTASTTAPSAIPSLKFFSSASSSSSPPTGLADSLPDAPGEVSVSHPADVVAAAEASFKLTGDGAKTCNGFRAMKVVYFNPKRYGEIPKPCTELIHPYQRFLGTDVIIPLTWQQKGLTALHDLTDPANFGTILGISAITIGTDSHSAYGPGFKGFGKTVGVSLAQDATGQFFGAFVVPVIAHQDPRYFRMPHATIPRRVIYSISRTFISRHDDGTPMPNYAALLNYPIGAEIANLYVPGINGNGASTVDRILTGIATDPANNLLNEFLPDVASRVHIRIIFVQQILNNITSGANGVTLQ
jgi:hypothetical protein